MPREQNLVMPLHKGTFMSNMKSCDSRIHMPSRMASSLRRAPTTPPWQAARFRPSSYDAISRAGGDGRRHPAISRPANMSSATGCAHSTAERAPPSEPRPSASVVLVSPTNKILMLRRVAGAGRTFAAAYVFPGGNVSALHDGVIPTTGPSAGGSSGVRKALVDEERDKDSLVYRLAAIRETFEESGILLARKKGGGDGTLLRLDSAAREEGRRAVHGNRVRFAEWLDMVGGVADTGGSKHRLVDAVAAVQFLTCAGRQPDSDDALDHARLFVKAIYYTDVPLLVASRVTFQRHSRRSRCSPTSSS